jgi:hypothetical protein
VLGTHKTGWLALGAAAEAEFQPSPAHGFWHASVSGK